MGGGNHPRREAPCTIMQLNNSEYPCLRSQTYQVTTLIVNQVRINCPYSGYHELQYYCRCVPGVVIVEPITLLSIFWRQQSWLLRCTTYHGCSVFPRRLSVIESGSFFFAIRSDLINIGLFIGNCFFWPLSDRNRFSSRYAILVGTAETPR